MSKRVLLAGVFHETHTFLESVTRLDEFEVRMGSALMAARGDGSPLAGVLEVAHAQGWELLPTIDVRARPSATVEDAVVEFFWDRFYEQASFELRRGVDGIFLVLHGAMASESIRDVEGEIIGRIRELAGARAVPICGVLDLHGNISPACVRAAQGLIAYRSNPHTDAQQTAIDAAALLERIMQSGCPPTMVWEQAPVMWPPTATGTDDDPMRTLEARAREIERSVPDIAAVNVCAGFSFADTLYTGLSFSAVTFGEPALAQAKLRELVEWATTNRELGNVIEPTLAQIMPQVRREASRGEGPILIVEPADNVGGGAPGDGTSVLRALIAHGIGNAAVVINDPRAVSRLRAFEPGSRTRLPIGGRGSRLSEGPIELEVELLTQSDGQFALEDANSHLASMSSRRIDMGPCAVVRHGGVRILLTSRKTPPFDLGQLRSQGIVPEELTAIGIKAAVAHRRAYEPIAKYSYTVSTPGPCSSDLARFPWKRVRRPVFPLDEIA